MTKLILYRNCIYEVCGMKKNKAIIKIVSIALLLTYLYSPIASAQEGYFKIAGQYRIRPEFRHGYKTLAADSSR